MPADGNTDPSTRPDEGAWLKPPTSAANIEINIPEGAEVSPGLKTALDHLIAVLQEEHPRALSPEANCNVITMRPCYIEYTCRIN